MPHPAPTRTLRTFALVAMLPILLAGCLFTSEPLLDGTNSVAGADSPELERFIEVSRSFEVPEGEALDEAPVPLFTAPQDRDDLSNIRVAPLAGGMLLVQEELLDCETEYCFAYYGVRVKEDGVPELCLVDTEANEALRADAPNHGVSLTVMDTGDEKIHLPPDVAVVGPRENQMAFLLAQFAENRLSCSSPDEP